jgi:hypothetical protein
MVTCQQQRKFAAQVRNASSQHKFAAQVRSTSSQHKFACRRCDCSPLLGWTRPLRFRFPHNTSAFPAPEKYEYARLHPPFYDSFLLRVNSANKIRRVEYESRLDRRLVDRRELRNGSPTKLHLLFMSSCCVDLASCFDIPPLLIPFKVTRGMSWALAAALIEGNILGIKVFKGFAESSAH